MINLDDPKVYKQYDPEDMLGHIHEVPQLCQTAWQMAQAFDLPQDYSQIDKIVVLGMGGSAIGGDLVASLVSAEAGIPVLVQRGYDLPASVSSQTLVIASSYSGMTEETLTAFDKALAAGLKSLAITTGGELKDIARDRNIPVFSFDYKAQPRAALAFSFFPILNFVQRLGFISDKSADVTETVETLEQVDSEMEEAIPLKDNQAKQLAKELYGKLAVVYGAGITAEVAHRWKTQLNENGKSWAFYEVFPELNHNAVVGYQFPKELTSKAMVVMLRSSHISQRILRRYQITSQLLEQAKIEYRFVDGYGISPLAHMMSLVLIGDYVSYYLAILNRTDPTPVQVIDFLKGELAKG